MRPLLRRSSAAHHVCALLAMLALLVSCSASTTLVEAEGSRVVAEAGATARSEAPSDDSTTGTDATDTTDTPDSATDEDATDGSTDNIAPDDDIITDAGAAAEAAADALSDDTTNDTAAGDEDESSDQADPNDASPDPANLGAESTTIVTVIDPGSEPRTALRLDIPPACAEIMTTTTTQSITQVIDGLPIPSDDPLGTTAELRLTSDRVPAGYRVTSEILSMRSSDGTPEEVRALLDAELRALEGLRISQVVDDRGLAVSGTFQLEGGEVLGPFEEVLEGFGQNSTGIALPEEPVGVGAVWLAESTTTSQGLTLETSQQYTLVAQEGSILTVETETSIFAPPGSVLEVLPGTLVDVVEMTGFGEGSSQFDLQSLAPIAGTSQIRSDQRLEADLGLGVTSIDQTIDQTISIDGRLDAGCTPRPGRARP
ncbi:MAG: hypothetical protein AAF567_20180 [Actinomycetota bacterium]